MLRAERKQYLRHGLMFLGARKLQIKGFHWKEAIVETAMYVYSCISACAAAAGLILRLTSFC